MFLHVFVSRIPAAKQSLHALFMRRRGLFLWLAPEQPISSQYYKQHSIITWNKRVKECDDDDGAFINLSLIIKHIKKLIEQMCWDELYTTVTLITSSHIKHMHEIMRNPSNLTVLPWQPKAIKSTSYELLHLSFLPHPSEGAAGRLATLRNETHNLSRYLVCDGAYGIYDSSGSFQRDQNKQKWIWNEFFCS